MQAGRHRHADRQAGRGADVPRQPGAWLGGQHHALSAQDRLPDAERGLQLHSHADASRLDRASRFPTDRTGSGRCAAALCARLSGSGGIMRLGFPRRSCLTQPNLDRRDRLVRHGRERMTVRKPGLVVTRRRALLGLAHWRSIYRQGGRTDPHRSAARQDRADRAADRISRAGHLSRAGGARQQDHGPAGGTGLARRAVAAGRHAEHAEAGAGEQGLRHPGRLAVVQRAGRGGDRRATEDSVRVRQRRGDRDHRQELQPLHVPAEHAGAGAIAHAGAVCAELRQEVVFHHRVVRVRPGHPALVARVAEAGRRHRGGHRRGAAEHRGFQFVHFEDPPGAAGRGAGRAVRRRSVHVPEAVERTWHEGEDPVLRDRDRRHRHLGGRPRGGERRVHQAVVVQQPEQSAGREGVRRRLLKKHNRPAADKAWMGWITAKSLFESIELAKSTEPMAIIEGLENWKFSAGGTSYSYRKWDHQMLLRNLVVSVKPKITDKWDYFDVKAALPENPAELEKVFGTPGRDRLQDDLRV